MRVVGADRIADLVKVESRQNEFICLLNISRIGLKRIDELSNMEWIDKEKVIEAVEKYKDVIVGLKARMSKSVVCDSGIEPRMLHALYLVKHHYRLWYISVQRLLA